MILEQKHRTAIRSWIPQEGSPGSIASYTVEKPFVVLLYTYPAMDSTP